MPNLFGSRRGGNLSAMPKRFVRSNEAVDLVTGCEGYYPLDDNLNDVSGKGRNLNDNGIIFSSSGLINQSIRGGNASGSGFLVNLTEFSVSAWFMFTSTAATETSKVYFSGGRDINIGIEAQRHAIGIGIHSRIYIYLNSATSGGGSGPLAQNVWHHAVLTVNSTERKLYINSELITTDVGFSFSANGFFVSADTRVHADEIAFYSKVLDATERAILRNNGLGFNPFA